MQWYYALGEQRVGPVSQAEFDRLVQAGTITPQTLVWQQGMTEWKTRAEVVPALPASAEPSIDGTEVCAVSGKRYPRREMIQYEGRWIAAEHRDEFFQRLREGVTQPGEQVYAGFWVRVLAKIIDSLALGLMGVVLNVACAMLMLGTPNYLNPHVSASSPTQAILFQVVTTVLGQLLALAFALFFVRRFDATPGKLALGLKVLRADGSKLTKGRIIGRHFSELISAFTFAIGYIMVAFDEEKRSLHDRICDTRVIKKR